MKDRKDDQIQGKFADALKTALKKRRKNPEQAARLLKVEVGTMYKYLAGDMIPGGQVVWLACFHLGMVLDENGFRTAARRQRATTDQAGAGVQYELPFINESITGEKIQAQVRRKDNQYVQVSLRIKVAG